MADAKRSLRNRSRRPSLNRNALTKTDFIRRIPLLPLLNITILFFPTAGRL